MIKRVYDTFVRPVLPPKVIVHNGVPAKTGRLLDKTDHRKDWEQLLMAAIRSQPLSGCDVVEVGGGLGICTAEIAKRVGPTGSVISFEADDDRIEKMNETLELNCVSDVVEVKNEYRTDVTTDCDVLVLDCEGAERQVLSGEYGDPDTVIAETHPVFDVPTQEIEDALERDGYGIETVHEGSNIDVIVAHS